MRDITTFLLALFFTSFGLHAQNWSLLQKDTIQFSRKQVYDFGINNNGNVSNSFGLSLVIDTFFNHQNQTVTYFQKDYSDLGSAFDSCAFSSPSIFGDSMIAGNDTAFFYVDSLNPLFWINNSSNWIFYANGTGNLQIQLDSVKASGSDSLKYYSFNVNAPVNNELQQFDTAQIVLSKAKGMLKGFDFSHFPDTLIELEYIKQGQITNREIYMYEVGDEVHFNTYGWLMNPAGFNQYIHKVLNKVVHNADSVSYTIEQIHSDNQNNVSVDTLVKSYNLDEIVSNGIFTFPSSHNIPNQTLLFSDHYKRPAFVISSQYDHFIVPFCRRIGESYEFRELVSGIGEFKHLYDGTDMNPKFYHENLLYYKKSIKTWGTPLTFTVGIKEIENMEVEVYPNPTEKIVKVRGLKEVCAYELFNFEGKRSKVGSLSNLKNEISVEDFQSGIYFLIITTGNNVIAHKIIIK